MTKSTVNYYLKAWGYDHTSMTRQPPAVRFQAELSNECWHFDLSPSDLKQIKQPNWVSPGRGNPQLMLYSVVDDRSGACYQEYRCVYGEDAETALRFLFNAMSAKPIEGFPFQGIPQMLYMDNGPIAKSQVFQNVMECLGVEVRTHLPNGKDGRRVTARSKGKVERPFRTVKEAHETLYHFHEPETEAEANRWLHQYLLNYNSQPHRSENHSRMEDWLKNLPARGLREMCSWERFCTFAREPEQRKVDGCARVSVEGVAYEVDPDLAGEKVILWWGLFDNELYVEKGDRRYGPYLPVDGPIPLHRYRKFKKSKTQERADRIEALAKRLVLPRAALEGNQELQFLAPEQSISEPAVIPFQDRDPFHKRLIEVAEDGGGILSIVLAGHPKLKNDLRRPTMEEIGYRTAVFSLDSIGGCQGAYIEWLLKSCTSEGTPLGELIAAEAIDLLSTRLRTPLQIEQHLSLAFEEAHRMGEKTVTEGIVSSILSKQIDDLEPILTRHGYNVKSLSEQFNAKPAEIRSLFRGLLDPVRTRELQEQMLAAGLPI